jgi:uncharacterized protein (TIGR01777 family)
MPRERVVLAGGSGFLGRSLTDELVDKGYEVVVLTRSPTMDTEHVKHVAWNGRTLGDWTTFLDGAKAVVNLTGKSVNCRYTPANRREIVDSRVDSVKVIGEAILKCRRPPKVLVQAATLAIYGDAGQRICDENAPAGTGFSVETCLLWEKTVASLKLPSTRIVVLRIGFALGTDGGALGTLARITKCYLGGTVGSGHQYISWIHLQDLDRMFLWSIERDDIEGVFNATGPNPVTNAEFMRQLRRTLNRPWSPPVPAWAARIGAWAMGSEAELALTGRRCVAKRFLEKDFEFKYSNLEGALGDLRL